MNYFVVDSYTKFLGIYNTNLILEPAFDDDDVDGKNQIPAQVSFLQWALVSSS